MENLTRRKLITQASVGAGAAGVLAITAACNTSNTTDTAIPDTTGIPMPTTDDPLAVFVTDPAKGTLIVMKGEKEIVVNNPGVAQSLLGLA